MQIFHRSANVISRTSIYVGIFTLAFALWACVDFQRSPYVTYAGVARYAGISDVGRALEIYASPKRKGKRKDPHINRGPGNYVSAAMENLHRSGFFLQRNLH